jgi:hypothetical protein
MPSLATLYHIFIAALPRYLLLQAFAILLLIHEFLDALAWLESIGIGDTTWRCWLLPWHRLCPLLLSSAALLSQRSERYLFAAFW